MATTRVRSAVASLLLMSDAELADLADLLDHDTALGLYEELRARGDIR